MIIGCKSAHETIIDQTYRSIECNQLDFQLSGEMKLKLGYHEILVFKVYDSINHGLYRFYTCHSTLLVDVGVVIQQ